MGGSNMGTVQAGSRKNERAAPNRVAQGFPPESTLARPSASLSLHPPLCTAYYSTKSPSNITWLTQIFVP